MKRIFMQIHCKYPHGGASANYLENLAKVFKIAGYSVILVSDINKEYSTLDPNYFGLFDAVYPIEYSKNEREKELQKEQGFAKERIGVLKDENITGNDIVFTYLIWNSYMLNKLFQYRDEIGFKVIAGMTELSNRGEGIPDIDYEMRKRTRAILVEKVDAVLTVSEYIKQYCRERRVPAFIIPPMIDYNYCKRCIKNNEKIRFVISTGKDSFGNMLKAFGELTEKELSKLEVHICSVKQCEIVEILGETAWGKLKEYMIIHDWMRYEELEELYTQMHFLLIAREECRRTLANFPSKVPETMAYGIVPVVSEVGDYTKYYLEDGKNSIFIHRDSVKEILKSIRKAIQLPEEEYNRYSDAAMRCARDRFDYHNWKSEICSMIEG